MEGAGTMHVLKIQRRTKAVGFISDNAQVGGLKARPTLCRESELCTAHNVVSKPWMGDTNRTMESLRCSMVMRNPLGIAQVSVMGMLSK